MNETKQLKKRREPCTKSDESHLLYPISRLSQDLQEAVGAAYLCMRAIDEIEDHEELATDIKTTLLRETALMMRGTFSATAYLELIAPYTAHLPEVTLRLPEWIAYCPAAIRPKVLDSTAEMAEGNGGLGRARLDSQNRSGSR